jgi:NADPH:quinone reductase-like Zn-dependent oxidoreductase
MSQTTLPRIPGRDFAGGVDAGPDVRIGAEVSGSGNAGVTVDGSHAEQIIVPVGGRARPSPLQRSELRSCACPDAGTFV